MILYVEQPFPYNPEEYRIDVHSVSARKPLFMDESAHDWRSIRPGVATAGGHVAGGGKAKRWAFHQSFFYICIVRLQATDQ